MIRLANLFFFPQSGGDGGRDGGDRSREWHRFRRGGGGVRDLRWSAGAAAVSDRLHIRAAQEHLAAVEIMQMTNIRKKSE